MRRFLLQTPSGEWWMWAAEEIDVVVIHERTTGRTRAEFKCWIPAEWPRQEWPVDFHD